jgi:hypothetical protein
LWQQKHSIAFVEIVQCPHLHQLRVWRRQTFTLSNSWSISSSDEDRSLPWSESLSSLKLLVSPLFLARIGMVTLLLPVYRRYFP